MTRDSVLDGLSQMKRKLLLPMWAVFLAALVGCSTANTDLESPPADERKALGRLPAAAIRGVVRKEFGGFVTCYEDALSRNPNLTGTVQVRFIIGLDGRVGGAQDHGSDIPDDEMVACSLAYFLTLQFPKPEGGTVIVTYPILFSPR